MLDDYAYGYELANPGELDSLDANNHPTKILRIYATVVANTTGANDAVTGFTKTTYYINVPSSITSNNTTKVFRTVKEARLSDGSYIPEKVTWELDGANGFIASLSTSTKCDKEVLTYVAATGTETTTRTYDVALTQPEITALQAEVFKQIPIHRCILIGKDALIETGIEGHTDFKMYTKPLGSAGVLDPIDQRQSIGMKCDTLGYSLLKPEAVVVCYTIPTGAVDTNDLMYTYGYSYTDTNDNNKIKTKGGNISMNTNSHMIPGNGYTQLQVEQGYNSYGKVNPVTGNVDTNRFNVPKGQVPYFKGSDEFGPAATPGKDRTEFPGASDADVKATNEQNRD